MSRIAFYAPMKPPDHPVPSGDRQMARTVMSALGPSVFLASTLRIYDGRGDAGDQAAIRHRAEAEVVRLIAQLRGGDVAVWVSYHNYYKAPDLIGPVVCAALNIPYVVIESSRAKSRLTGPWADFAAAAEAASDAAGLIFYLTRQDHAALERDRPPCQHLIHLRPPLPINNLPPPAHGTDGRVLCAGMMRAGDKLASYRLIAQTLALVPDPWRVDIAGDGPERAGVERMMAPLATRIRFLGQCTPEEMQQAYGRAALFLWPGVNEAFGMVYLEAQSHGLPVVAQDRPGLRDVLAPGEYPPADAGPAALAAATARLLADPALRADRAAAARAHIARFHLIGRARDTLRAGLARVVA